MRVDVKNKSIVSSIDSSGGYFVCQRKTICAILVESIMGNIHVKLFYRRKVHTTRTFFTPTTHEIRGMRVV